MRTCIHRLQEPISKCSLARSLPAPTKMHQESWENPSQKKDQIEQKQRQKQMQVNLSKSNQIKGKENKKAPTKPADTLLSRYKKFLQNLAMQFTHVCFLLHLYVNFSLFSSSKPKPNPLPTANETKHLITSPAPTPAQGNSRLAYGG